MECAEMKKIAILGSTGSIGRQCLSVVESMPGRFAAVALAAGENVELLATQVRQHGPLLVSVADSARDDELAAKLRAQGVSALPEIQWGSGGLESVATHPEAHVVVSAAVGVVGLPATYAAVRAGKQVALSNKEVLVAAGELIMALARARGVELLPVDSEHNAIHQCLRAGERREVRRLVLTASGGPFRKTPLNRLRQATP
jgi:1-deoxy-D-xylulose-5-phosphate reductoisomerase